MSNLRVSDQAIKKIVIDRSTQKTARPYWLELYTIPPTCIALCLPRVMGGRRRLVRTSQNKKFSIRGAEGGYTNYSPGRAWYVGKKP